MKLSEEAKKWAEALMHKDHYQVALWSEKNINRIRAARTLSNPLFNQIIAHHEESLRKTFTYIINAYVEAYKMDESLIDDEDNDEIIQFIKDMINSRLHHVTNSVVGRDFYHPYTGEKIPDLESQLSGHFDRLLGEAAIELNLARNQLVLEQKQRAKEDRMRANQINIYGHNYGNIQQGGENNSQSINRVDKDE